MSLDDERREIAWLHGPHDTQDRGGIAPRAADGTMPGAFGESGGNYKQDVEIGQLGAKVFREM